MVDETIVLEAVPELHTRFGERAFSLEGGDVLEITPEPAAAAYPEGAGMALVPLKRGAPADAEPAPPPAPIAPPIPPEKHVIFSAAGASYAIPITHVLEVGELGSFTPVPNVPDWVMGVTNLRGDIVSLIDFRSLLGIDPEDQRPDARNLLLTQTLEGDITACLAVKQVTGVAGISPSQIQTIDTVAGDKLTPYVSGIYAQGDALVSILNLEGLLRSLDLSYSQQ